MRSAGRPTSRYCVTAVPFPDVCFNTPGRQGRRRLVPLVSRPAGAALAFADCDGWGQKINLAARQHAATSGRPICYDSSKINREAVLHMPFKSCPRCRQSSYSASGTQIWLCPCCGEDLSAVPTTGEPGRMPGLYARRRPEKTMIDRLPQLFVVGQNRGR